MRPRSSKAARSESGQALVEFALVLPLLVVLLIGIVDMSKAYNYWNDHNQLAGVAARQAAIGRNPDPATYPTLADWVRAQAETAELRTGGSGRGVQSPGICISITAPDGATVGKPVVVEVESTYRFFSLPLAGVSLGDANMRGSATMRLENDPPAGILTTAAC